MPSLVNVVMLEPARAALAFHSAQRASLPGAAVVGSFGFRGDAPDWRTFRANPKFVEQLERFMRGS